MQLLDIPDDVLGEILLMLSPAKDLVYIPFESGEQTILLWINERWPVVCRRWYHFHCFYKFPK